jgi:SnoaL-like domain
MSAGATPVAETRPGAAADAWVAGFAEGWRAPAGASGLVANFAPILAPEIRLVQPQMPTLVGLEDFRHGFAEPLFELIPDLHGRVLRWAARGDDLFIVVELEGTLGGRPVRFTSCDRVTLRDGVAIEREAHMDPTPLLAAVLRAPRAWPTFLRVQLAALRRRRRR